MNFIGCVCWGEKSPLKVSSDWPGSTVQNNPCDALWCFSVFLNLFDFPGIRKTNVWGDGFGGDNFHLSMTQSQETLPAPAQWQPAGAWKSGHALSQISPRIINHTRIAHKKTEHILKYVAGLEPLLKWLRVTSSEKYNWFDYIWFSIYLMYHTGTGVRKNLITKAKLIAVGMTEAQADPHLQYVTCFASVACVACATSKSPDS